MKKDVKELKQEFETDELEDFDLNNTDPIYVLSIIVEGEKHKLIDCWECGEFQYVDDAEKAFETVKECILEVRNRYSDEDIKSIIIELEMTIAGESIETIERSIFEF